MMTLQDLAERKAKQIGFDLKKDHETGEFDGFDFRDDCDEEELQDILSVHFYHMQDQIEALCCCPNADVVSSYVMSYLSNTDKEIKKECAESIIKHILKGVSLYSEQDINDEYNRIIIEICNDYNPSMEDSE